MYQLLSGLLHRDGEPIFCLGQSYYPSYHPMKVPVLENGDRLGEMAKDLRAMKDAGFHLVRMAALGDMWPEAEGVGLALPLPDAFLAKCHALDLAAMIRLQGYSVNLHGHAHTDMLDQDGNPMENHWSWFLRSCLHHPGILQDNITATRALAAHFADFPALVSFQIYNEPAYPTHGLFDYHPDTLLAYRQWLQDKGLKPEDPPPARPAPGEDPLPFARFRLFSMERLTAFLCRMGDTAKEGYAAPGTLTCHMGCPISPGAMVRGEDYFDTAKGMDILGITSYTPCRGPSYYIATLQLALAESAAATFGKKAWLIEYNARTGMPPQEWQRETCAAIGSGIKGILYYQWRADFPFADGPEPEGFGLLYNSGEKTPVYDTAIAMNRLVNGIGNLIATADKARAGLGILYSHHQHAISDARDNGAAADISACRERSILALRRLYALLGERQIPVDFARACDLAENPLGIRTLLLPYGEGLAPDELDALDAFVAAGGQAFIMEESQLGFTPYARERKARLHGILYDQYGLDTLLDVCHIAPPAKVVGHPSADAKLLIGPNHWVCAITNLDPLERPVENAILHLPGCPYGAARAYSLCYPEGGIALPLQDERISLPTFHYGAIIIIKEA